MSSTAPALLAEVVRNGFVEGQHFGHAVIVDADGSIVQSWGDPHTEIFPRSSNKPAQALGMLRCGLDLPPDLLALSLASHSGERMHLDGVLRILDSAGLIESSLQTPPDYPLDDVERDDWIAQHRVRASIAMNCSGKHAAMLATCVLNGWPTDSYLAPEHPLQVSISATVAELADESVDHVGVDGCGAPLLSLSVAGLARSLGHIARGDVDPRIASAMQTHPELVGGSRRVVTELMRSVPGLIAKDGAEGVQVLALPDGRAAALKVLDGSERARTVATIGVLSAMGCVDLPVGQRELPLLGGGRQVGMVRSPLGC